MDEGDVSAAIDRLVDAIDAGEFDTEPKYTEEEIRGKMKQMWRDIEDEDLDLLFSELKAKQ